MSIEDREPVICRGENKRNKYIGNKRKPVDRDSATRREKGGMEGPLRCHGVAFKKPDKCTSVISAEMKQPL